MSTLKGGFMELLYFDPKTDNLLHCLVAQLTLKEPTVRRKDEAEFFNANFSCYRIK